MKASKIQKAIKKLQQGVWFYYGHPNDGYIASAAIDRDWHTGEMVNGISYHKGEMPAFDGERFDTAEELAQQCLRLQPDLRRWHTMRYKK